MVVLLACCVLVPCVFTTRVNAAFVVPKLAVLWGAFAACLAIVAAAVLAGARRLPAQLVLSVDLAVAAFFAFNLAAWAFSIDREQSLYGERFQHQGLLTTILYLGFFYVARVSITDGRRLRLLVAAIALGAALVSGYALVQRAGLDPVWDGYLPGGNVFSSIGHANALAAYLVLVIPLAAGLAFVGQTVLRWVAAAATAAMVSALVLTGSRGGYIAALAVAATLAVGWRAHLGRLAARRRQAAALLAATAVVIAAAAIAGVLPSVSGYDASVRFHLDAWRIAVEIAADNPVVGTGPETFPDVFPGYSHALLPEDRALALDAFRVESPHNVYLGIAAGSGIPALLAYLGVIGAFTVAVVRALPRVPSGTRALLVGVLGAAAGHLAADFFITADLTSTWLFWLAMGAVLGSLSGERRRATSAGASPSSPA